MAFYDNIAFVNGRCTDDELLDQLIEECAELIQACGKLKRAHKGTTPLPLPIAIDNFIEEMADVSVAQAAVVHGIMDSEQIERMFAIEREKAERWQVRLEKMNA